MDREAWHATVHWVARSQTRLSDWTELKRPEVRAGLMYSSKRKETLGLKAGEKSIWSQGWGQACSTLQPWGRTLDLMLSAGWSHWWTDLPHKSCWHLILPKRVKGKLCKENNLTSMYGRFLNRFLHGWLWPFRKRLSCEPWIAAKPSLPTTIVIGWPQTIYLDPAKHLAFILINKTEWPGW